jgi:hypothetical protein
MRRHAALPPRVAIARRVQVINMLLSDRPRRGERDEEFAARIGSEIEGLARRIADAAVDLRRSGPDGERAEELGRS